jgi:4-amino-4-deoxy-L-arabinose transferase-like glycosyltransferase
MDLNRITSATSPGGSQPAPTAAKSGVGDRWFAIVATGLTAALLVGAGFHANRIGATGETLLSSLDGPFEALIEAGGRLYHGFKHAGDPVRLVVLLASLAWLVRVRSISSGAPSRLVVALLVAWIAQSFAMDGRLLVGVGIYAFALVVYLWGREPVEEPAPMLPAGVEIAVLSILMLFFTVTSLYRLDVLPLIHWDEVAYYAASRMQLGELPPGKTWVYPFERFQAQPIPFWIFTASVKIFSPGVLAIRFAAMASGAVALLVAVLTLRRRIGSMTALWMVALCSISPIYLAFARVGFYVAVSILHSVACFAVLVWFHERRNRTSAVVLGVFTGASIFAYQVSWFIPVLVAATFLVSPRGWLQRDARRAVAIAIAVAAAVVVPGILSYQTGFETLREQTFDKGYWQQGDLLAEDSGVLQLLAPESLAPEAAIQFTRLFEGADIEVNRGVSRTQRTVVNLIGSSDSIQNVRRSFEDADWEVLMDSTESYSLWSNAGTMLARLFYAPRFQNFVRFSDEPVLAPLCASLFVLGLAEALRRRRLATIRILLVWVIGGVLLASSVAGAYPRRMVLALPFAQAVMALPIVEIQRSIRQAGPRARRSAWLALVVLFAIAAAMGSHLYVRHWDILSKPMKDVGSKGELIKVIKGLPADEPVLLWPIHSKFVQLLATIEDEPPPGSPQRIFVIGRAKKDPNAIRQASCQRELPLSWVAPNTEIAYSKLEILQRDFRYSSSKAGVFRVLRLEERKPGSCR